MSLLFGGKPEEVPLRRQILRVVVFAASKASTIAIISPVFKGDHCSALPSARAYLMGLSIWSIQAGRGGANSNCDNGIYSAVGVSAWICVAIFVAILVYIALIVAGVVPNPKKEKAPLEAPLDAEASVE